LSSVRSNFAANLAGQAWVTLTQLLVVPFYIKFLGIEAYGLMGFFVALQATVQVLDLGLAPTLTREIARRRAMDGGLADARSLVKTVSISYFVLSMLIGLSIVLAAPLFASHVIHAESLDRHAVESSVMLMGALIPVMWGTSLFNATLVGMERQVLVNVLRIATVTASSLGAVVVLWLVSADIRTFFLWYLLAGLLSWIVAGWIALRVLPAGPSRFRRGLLSELWKFAAGMSAITVGGIVLMQLDKWLLINLLPLQSYGHYILALALANALYFVITPLFSSVFPRMTLLHAQSDQHGQASLYHSSAQYIAALVFPLATVICLFAEPILRLWIQDAEIARNAAPIASILVWGTALNGLMNVPYAMQLATGRTSLAIRLVVLKLILFAPVIVFLTLHFGATGAAVAWLALNAIYVLVGIPLTHAHLLKGHAGTWIMEDVLPSAGAALAVGGLALLFRPSGDDAVAMSGFLAVTTLVALTAAGLAGRAPRAWVTLQAAKFGILRNGS
jgi:O-antigen/teichoic acid export membrane protein